MKVTIFDNGRHLILEKTNVDVDDEFVGVVVEALSLRKAEMQDMRSSGSGKTRIIF